MTDGTREIREGENSCAIEMVVHHLFGFSDRVARYKKSLRMATWHTMFCSSMSADMPGRKGIGLTRKDYNAFSEDACEFGEEIVLLLSFV